MAALDFARLNTLEKSAFIGVIGPVFEHSPWIAEAVWSQRPFSNLSHLHAALCDVVQRSSREQQLTLIQAHPDLVGGAALAGTLTPSSASEQASAGLDQLTPAEIESFQSCNKAYLEKFGFPFVICARLNKKEAILNGFKTRLNHSSDDEIQTGLEEIYKIAYFRLQDIVKA